jgi:hypothetical protein
MEKPAPAELKGKGRDMEKASSSGTEGESERYEKDQPRRSWSLWLV